MSQGAPLTPNQKVVVWARGKLGQKIGRGQCWDLGEHALKQAGAHTFKDGSTIKETKEAFAKRGHHPRS